MFDCDPMNPIVEVPQENGHLSDKYKYLLDIILRIKHPHSEQLQSVERQEGHLATVEYITRNISIPKQRTIPVKKENGETKVEWVPLEPNCHILRDERCMYRNDFETLERIVQITELFMMNSNLPPERLEEHLNTIKGHVKTMQEHFLEFAEEAKWNTKQTRNYQGTAQENRQRLLDHAERAAKILNNLEHINTGILYDRPVKKDGVRIQLNL